MLFECLVDPVTFDSESFKRNDTLTVESIISFNICVAQSRNFSRRKTN